LASVRATTHPKNRRRSMRRDGSSRWRWQGCGRTLAPDTVPIVILQPFGPVQFV
jgi:hypothetical protein